MTSRPPAGGLSEERVRAAWPSSAPIQVRETTGSTNDDAKALARSGAAHGALCLAGAQTSGRGRSGSSWYSPPGENLYASIVLVPRASRAAPVATFTLAVGIVVARTIDARLDGAPARIKWPNDVHVRGRKIAGILVEGTSRGASPGPLVVGVGINIATRAFPEPLGSIATSLALEGSGDLDPSSLAASLARGLVEAFDLHELHGLAPFLSELRDKDALLGARVRVDGVIGRADGIEPDGSLAILGEDGVRHPVIAGHVERC